MNPKWQTVAVFEKMNKLPYLYNPLTFSMKFGMDGHQRIGCLYIVRHSKF